MIEIIKPVIECKQVSEDGKYAQFVVEPLRRGFGDTLGNSLRRILLSSLPGAAATQIRIEGVLHEFTTVPGVKEDVTNIILNIKNIAMKLDSDTPITATINAVGPCVVTAGDIKGDSTLEIINKDLHIATIDEGGVLNMEIVIDKGMGYVPADKNKSDDMPIDVIAVDSIYTPILKASYLVQSARVGRDDNFDKLILDVWTDGSIRPDEAISIAAKVMNDYLALFVNLAETVGGIQLAEDKEGAQPQSKALDMTIDELDLSVRSYNCLKRAGINSVQELAQLDEADLMRVRNLGKKSMDEVRAKLAGLGLKLKNNED
ncbi:MAG: DNA-directed RNA polymerase subunit alpha [Clostridiales bacterium]|nr:DNA-directed RNA polymerase subunit alpha [Clostridiales bacterium]